MTASTFIIAGNIGKMAEKRIRVAREADKAVSEGIKLYQKLASKSKASSKWKKMVEGVAFKALQYTESFDYHPLEKFSSNSAEFTLLMNAYSDEISDAAAFKQKNSQLLLTDAIFPKHQERVKQLEVDLLHLERALSVIDNDFEFASTNIEIYEKMAADYQALLDVLQTLETNSAKRLVNEKEIMKAELSDDTVFMLLNKKGVTQRLSCASVFGEGSKLDKTDPDAFEAVILSFLKNGVASLKQRIDGGLRSFYNPNDKHRAKRPGEDKCINQSNFDLAEKDCKAKSLDCQKLAAAKEAFLAKKQQAQLAANKAPLQHINPQQSSIPNQTVYKTPGVTSFAQATAQKQIAGSTAGTSLSPTQSGKK